MKSDDTRARDYLQKIDVINSKSPQSFRAQFVVDGSLENKRKFKSIGSCVYSKAHEKFKMVFIDSVFRSPLATVLQEGRVLKIYLPVEKKLYVDHADKIRLKDYSGIDIDYRFISSLAMGMIPLIDDYSIKQGLKYRKENKREESDYFIILENDSLFETISLKNDIPNKILLVNKKTLEKMEFYLENPESHGDGGSLYYKQIRFLSVKKGERINLRFTGIQHNARINDQQDFRINMPGNVKSIRVH
ncbi:MAG TPA: hypothetical protein PK200_03325 [Spirochaetota bacterium]|nr:hypothetical protein [Spirochaetota bacterium]HQO01818.1 hypothetical protein [Spirochaetota bacterium]HQP47119.1 hypothetical protein [Spirochaetota bacterium]